ncbi:MAG: hypothetical protein U0168_18080 [Nannocystaceae bacterium]
MSGAIRLATRADLDGARAVEIVGGVIVDKANPSFENGESQQALAEFVGPFRRGGGGRPGWWITPTASVTTGSWIASTRR